MSWQTYVDDHLMCDIEGNHLTSAAILGHDGSVWAQSASFPKVAPTKYGGSLGTLCQIGTCLGIIASLILGSPSENDPHWGDK